MATVTEPILTDATGQDIVDKLDELVGAVRPTASDIPLTPPSGMTATNVQDGFSEIKQSLSDLIKTKNIGNVSTSTNGNITIADLNYDDVIGLKVTCNFTSYIATFGKASDGTLFIHFTNAAGQIYSGTITSGTLYYMTR